MFEFRNRQFSENDEFIKIEEATSDLDDTIREKGPPWYKRIITRLMNWVKRKRRNKSKDPLKEMYKIQFNIKEAQAEYNKTNSNSNNPIKNPPKNTPSNNPINYNTSKLHPQSAEDIPRNSLNLNIVKGEGELSPMTTEPWKDDSTLMINGTYSRFKMVPIFSAKYRLISIIGQGSFGFVLKAERLRDFKEVAIKFIYKQNINSSNWMFDSEIGLIPSEVFYLKSLNHPGIVQFFDYFNDGRYIYLITELFGTSWCPLTNGKLNSKRNPGINLDGGTKDAPCDLFECIEAHKNLPEITIHFIFKQLVEIAVYLSSRGIAHRDLKDENVVVDADYRIKIVDFGCAARIPFLEEKRDEEGWFEKFNGTLAFAPPEVIRGHRYRASEAEIWTLGVLLYTMAFRQAPFPDAQSILYSQLEFPFEEDVPGILDLMRKLLVKNPQNRIKLTQVQSHPWLCKGPS